MLTVSLIKYIGRRADLGNSGLADGSEASPVNAHVLLSEEFNSLQWPEFDNCSVPGCRGTMYVTRSLGSPSTGGTPGLAPLTP